MDRSRQIALTGLALGLASFASGPVLADDFGDRKTALIAAAALPFVDDPIRAAPESALDQRSFQELLGLVGPKIVTNPMGWEVIARTGGRPFLNFDEISVDGTPVVFNPSGFGPGSTGIPQAELDSHFAAGKQTNRLWFTHPASNGFPTVLVLTPDGFANLSGAEAPLLLGSAVRMGFIGEPFDLLQDYIQHAEAFAIDVIDDDQLLLVFDVHSEGGEAVVEIELHWEDASERPRLELRVARAARFSAHLGFVGLNFLRGPTLSGLKQQCPSPEGGIEAFHDGRTAFLVPPAGLAQRILLVPPTDPGVVLRQDISTDVAPGSKAIVDQPQNVLDYFSKQPGVSYEARADLAIELATASSQVSFRRAQIAVDLSDPNPEANETANLFLSADLGLGTVDEFSFIISVSAVDYEATLGVEQPQGVIFVSDGRLQFMELDGIYMPTGSLQPLTDGLITDPRRPSLSGDGQTLLFDAVDFGAGSLHRAYSLDLRSGAVRRLSVDPFGASFDQSVSISPDGLEFALITNRHGSPYQLVLEDFEQGLGCGFGNEVRLAGDAEWSQSALEIAYTNSLQVRLLDILTDTDTLVATGVQVRAPSFSPSGELIAYAYLGGIGVVERTGANNALVISDGEHPTWAGESTLIVERGVAGIPQLFVVDIAGGTAVQITSGSGASEPVFVPGSAPVEVPTLPLAGLASLCVVLLVVALSLDRSEELRALLRRP